MNENHWKRLSDERVADAQILLNGKRWPAAYYLAGYAVECRLKACIVKKVQSNPGIVFDKSKFIDKIWTHDISALSTQADLNEKIIVEGNGSVPTNWSLVKKWKETSRYDFPSELDAINLFNAVTEPNVGVLAWIELNA